MESRQRDLGIEIDDAQQIEQPILAEAEAKHRDKLKRKEEADRQRQQEAERLKQLALQKEREKEEHSKKLLHYEKKFLEAVYDSYPLEQDVRNVLITFQQSLGLSDEDVEPIEKLILDRKELEYQNQLRQKEEAEKRGKQREEYHKRLEAEKLNQQRDRVNLH